MHYLLRTVNRGLEQENGEAKAFYSSLPKPSLIKIEATGYTAVVRTDVGGAMTLALVCRRSPKRGLERSRPGGGRCACVDIELGARK